MSTATATPLPQGRVTMLFTDIEGSTKLAHRSGRGWPKILAAHHSILRTAISRNRGHEMRTEGDSFFAVFDGAGAALSAALDSQRALAEAQWPDDASLRVRMGLHAGEPQLIDGDYVGVDVHLAARVAATAHGGQVVVTESTIQALPSKSPPLQTRDLGWHRLKDFDQPQRLYQAVVPGSDEAFPPLRSLGLDISLPVYRTPLVGRETALADLHRRIVDEHARLVTLLGPGGAGKTRLAIAGARIAASRFASGVYFVALDTVVRADGIWPAIAGTLDASGSADKAARERVLDYLSDRTLLLVLDNLEQIAEPGPVIDEIINRCPGVSVIATSRRPLQVVGEHRQPVMPLPFRHDRRVAAPAQGLPPALEMFAQHACMARPDFVIDASNRADVERLCRRLDGLPLAIELVAARAGLLSASALLKHVDQLDTLHSSARPERQRSLSATVAWSYALLDESDQRVFRQLAPFEAPISLDAMEAVAQVPVDETLATTQRLADTSLVRIETGPDDEPRLRLLETIRAFARSSLAASGEAEAVRMRHALWCIEATERAHELLATPRHTSGLDRIQAIEPDILAVFDWTLSERGGTDREADEARIALGFRLLKPMSAYWYRYSYTAGARIWQERAVAVVRGRDSPFAVDALHGLGLIELQQGELSAGMEHLAAALDMARRIGARSLEARELNSLSIARLDAHDVTGALDYVQQSAAIAQELDDPSRYGTSLTNLAVALTLAERYDDAVAAGRKAIEVNAQFGDPWRVAIDRVNLAAALLFAQGPAAAQGDLLAHAQETIALGDRELSVGAIEIFACCRALLEDPATAAVLMGCADEQRRGAGIPRKSFDERVIAKAAASIASLPLEQRDAATQRGAAMDLDGALALGLAAVAQCRNQLPR